ncbi:hypothetical protein [Lyngbya aestuarii]
MRPELAGLNSFPVFLCRVAEGSIWVDLEEPQPKAITQQGGTDE